MFRAAASTGACSPPPPAEPTSRFSSDSHVILRLASSVEERERIREEERAVVVFARLCRVLVFARGMERGGSDKSLDSRPPAPSSDSSHPSRCILPAQLTRTRIRKAECRKRTIIRDRVPSLGGGLLLLDLSSGLPRKERLSVNPKKRSTSSAPSPRKVEKRQGERDEE